MRRFGVLVASAALSAALAASGPALAFGGGHMGGGFSGGHMGGGFGGGHFGGFAGRSMAMGGNGFGFNRSVAGFNRGFAGRSAAIGGVNHGFAFNRGFDHRFARFDHFHHFHNRFAFFPFFSGGGWDYGYPYWDDAYYGRGYPDYAYDYSYPGYDYSYASPGYAAAPLVTGRSVATGQMGNYCTTPVKTCELYHASSPRTAVPAGFRVAARADP